MKIERPTATITKENTLKYGCYQTVNNAACYYQTQHNIAVIVEKSSKHNSILQEKIEMEECRIQHKRQSSEVNNCESKLSAFATAHAPTIIEKKREEVTMHLIIIGLNPKRRCQ